MVGGGGRKQGGVVGMGVQTPGIAIMSYTRDPIEKLREHNISDVMFRRTGS